MPHREKIAWLSLLAMAVTFGPYFAVVASGRLAEGGPPNLRLLALFAATAIAQMLLLGAVHGGLHMPFSFGGWAIVNGALATIVAAELVHYAVVVVSYRKEA